MASLRAVLFFGILAFFFVVGVPLQALVARRAPRLAHAIPTFFCRCLLWPLRLRVTVEGRPADGRPLLVASNHVSWFDILALGSLEPFCFLAKKEVGAWPLLSAFARVQGTVFIDRARRRGIVPANRELAARMRDGRMVLLFPEGTTVGGGVPGPFLSSHFAAARELLAASDVDSVVLVQPVALVYSSERAAWVGNDDLMSHLRRTLRAPPLECAIRFGAAIPFTPASNRKVIAAMTRDVVTAMIAKPSSETAKAGPPPAPADGAASLRVS